MKSKKLRILFDANPLAQSGKSGVGYYTEGIVRALADTFPNDIELIGHYYDFLGRKSPTLPNAPNIRYRRTVAIPGKVIFGLRKLGVFVPIELMARRRADVHLFPNYFMFPSVFRSPAFTTIHDTYFMVKPEEVSPRNAAALKRFVPHTIKHSRKILTVSEFSKREIVSFFNADSNKIAVTPIPPSTPEHIDTTEADALLEKFSLHKDFILFLGNIEPRKNIVNLVKAYRSLPEELKQAHPLVLAGGKGWQDDEILAEIDAALAAGEPIVQTGYVSDAERVALYHNAAAVVLPSKYEGFGMQLLEAMAYEKPVFASDLAVFHEVAGNSAIYFNQNSPESISKTFRAIDDVKLLEELKKRQQKNLLRFSWEKVARNLYDEFQKALAKNI